MNHNTVLEPPLLLLFSQQQLLPPNKLNIIRHLRKIFQKSFYCQQPHSSLCSQQQPLLLLPQPQNRRRNTKMKNKIPSLEPPKIPQPFNITCTSKKIDFFAISLYNMSGEKKVLPFLLIMCYNKFRYLKRRMTYESVDSYYFCRSRA